MIQKSILSQIIDKLKADSNNNAVLLVGSVANGTASIRSDIDLLILGNENKFVTEHIGQLLVEYIYLTYERANENLIKNSMDVYHYLESKIIFDYDERLKTLQSCAQNIFNNYKTTDYEKKALYHWLSSVKMKLLAAYESTDIIKVNFLTMTNSWKVIEAVWAINNMPIPPSSKVIPNLGNLKIIPYDNWFEALFNGDYIGRTKSVLTIIDWAIQLLNTSS